MEYDKGKLYRWRTKSRLFWIAHDRLYTKVHISWNFSRNEGTHFRIEEAKGVVCLEIPN